ncbi:MAG: cysteine-rich CWC family protein [Alphaproteobacteria bacterium]|nr:cysteine-rich CWC family protein [Alphaproteobacteria bacterium]
MSDSPSRRWPALQQKTCPRCARSFGCGTRHENETCWCESGPKIEPSPNEDCLCPDCLRERAETGP